MLVPTLAACGTEFVLCEEVALVAMGVEKQAYPEHEDWLPAHEP